MFCKDCVDHPAGGTWFRPAKRMVPKEGRAASNELCCKHDRMRYGRQKLSEMAPRHLNRSRRKVRGRKIEARRKGCSCHWSDSDPIYTDTCYWCAGTGKRVDPFNNPITCFACEGDKVYEYWGRRPAPDCPLHEGQ